MFFIICLLGIISSIFAINPTYPQKIYRNNYMIINSIQKSPDECIRIEKETSWIDISDGCINSSNNLIECGVCLDLWDWINIDISAELFIDWDLLDLTLTLDFNNVPLFETTFGINSPPYLCASFSGLDICIGFNDLELINWNLTGCLDLTIDGLHITLGCFDLSK